MRVGIACPDKFRGTLTAPQAAAAIGQGLRSVGFEVHELPLADGGEGTLATLLAARGGVTRRARVTGPLGASVDATWGRLPDGVAVVEMARASGLSLVDEPDPLRASTRGTGELIAAALRTGANRVIVGVGGSASTDGGLAAVEALGWSLVGADVVVACDVTTPFLRAAAEFAPQKGATRAQVALLERRLARLADEYRARTGVDVTEIPGGGAAGGLAGGLAALGARLEPGFEVVADAVGLDLALEAADLVVTGEGRVDASSFEGKVVGGVLELARPAARAVIAGQVADEVRSRLPPDVLVRELVDGATSVGEARERAATLVTEAAVDVGRTVLAGASPPGA